MKNFLGLRAKLYHYLTDDSSEDKKAKGTKKCVINCLEASQLENKPKNLEKNEIDIDSLQKGYKEFIKNDKLILKTQ